MGYHDLDSLAADFESLIKRCTGLRDEIAALEECRATLRAGVAESFGLQELAASDLGWISGRKYRKSEDYSDMAYTYALFSGDELAYIGVTTNWRMRRSAHGSKKWDSFVVQRWPTLVQAEQAETYSIHALHPPLNAVCRLCSGSSPPRAISREKRSGRRLIRADDEVVNVLSLLRDHGY